MKIEDKRQFIGELFFLLGTILYITYYFFYIAYYWYVEKDPTAFCTYEEFQTGVETLKEFCSLRAESIKGQLDGTIPSDSQGQQEDSSSLIDASDLAISDMGSMGNMGGMRDDTSSDKVPGNAPEEMNFSDFGGSGVPSPPDAEASERRGIPADRSSSAEQSSADSG